MKNLIVCISGFIFISNLHAQSNFYKDSSLFSLRNKQQLFHNYNYSGYQNHNLIIPGIDLNKNPKPVDLFVLKLPQPVLTYKIKTGHLNIYQSSPDNMYVAMPDSTFVFNMPVAGSQ